MNTKLMKTLVAFVAVVLTLINASPPAIAASIREMTPEITTLIATAPREIRLYEHRDFQGNFEQFDGSAAIYYPINPQLSNQISSLIVPARTTVTLVDTDGRGKITFTGSANYVGDGMNDQADMIEITSECAPGADVC